MSESIIVADYNDPQHAGDIVQLLDNYARDPMGGGEPLSDYTRAHLIEKLQQIPGAFSLLCYHQGCAVGFANCLMGFSSFKCYPLINIHDIAVLADFRGRGIARQMLTKIEDIARQRGCCKITLEVLQGNVVAQSAYRKFGFAGYELDPKTGEAMMWQKLLS